MVQYSCININISDSVKGAGQVFLHKLKQHYCLSPKCFQQEVILQNQFV